VGKPPKIMLPYVPPTEEELEKLRECIDLTHAQLRALIRDRDEWRARAEKAEFDLRVEREATQETLGDADKDRRDLTARAERAEAQRDALVKLVRETCRNNILGIPLDTERDIQSRVNEILAPQSAPSGAVPTKAQDIAGNWVEPCARCGNQGSGPRPGWVQSPCPECSPPCEDPDFCGMGGRLCPACRKRYEAEKKAAPPATTGQGEMTNRPPCATCNGAREVPHLDPIHGTTLHWPCPDCNPEGITWPAGATPPAEAKQPYEPPRLTPMAKPPRWKEVAPKVHIPYPEHPSVAYCGIPQPWQGEVCEPCINAAKWLDPYAVAARVADALYAVAVKKDDPAEWMASGEGLAVIRAALEQHKESPK